MPCTLEAKMKEKLKAPSLKFFSILKVKSKVECHTPIGKMKIKNLGCQALGFLHFLS
jgi:hypothetical protein